MTRMMSMRRELLTRADIIFLVDTFYGAIREDAVLGPIFMGVIQDRWPEHLDKMYRFWETVLLEAHTYQGSPFGPHAHMAIDTLHFERWLEIFHACIDTHFQGPKAEEAKWRSGKMAILFLSKIEYLRDHPNSFVQ